ncbi:MAG: hypothetical protein D6744_00505, partial [Planctomycetota bacterium]
PTRHGDMLRLLGPSSQQAAIAVEPFVKLDEPLTVVQSFIGGFCDGDGRLVQPLEIEFVVDPASVVPHKQVPAGALLRAFNRSAAVRENMPQIPGTEIARQVITERRRLAPLFFCREARRLFAARSPYNCEVLTGVVVDDPDESTGNPDLPLDLLSWDGVEGHLWGGAGGETTLGTVASLEELLLGQGKVVQQALALIESDARQAIERGAADWCCQCPACRRVDADDAEYKSALDRLVIVNVAEVPMSVQPLGAWRLRDAAQIVGGRPPSEICAEAGDPENEFEAWRRRQAEEIETAAPIRLLSGETDGRDLIEIARLKLELIAQVLEQLDAAWRFSDRPHLCWNDETVRVLWRRPAAVSASAWGFQPLLRKVGLQPPAPIDTPDEATLAYPPAFSMESLLAPEVLDAAREFDEPRTATVFIKKLEKGSSQPAITVLLEELGLPWESFCTRDVVHVSGGGWRLVLAPCAERDPNDGEGLPFEGFAVGDKVADLKIGEQYEKREVRWYPRFDQAVDLHALGVLLLESLLAHDERTPEGFREALLADRDELTRSSATLSPEQREEHARRWLSQRSEADAPASLWTRRNLYYCRADRAATGLDAFGADLWQAVLMFGLRMITTIPGFSFCD